MAWMHEWTFRKSHGSNVHGSFVAVIGTCGGGGGGEASVGPREASVGAGEVAS